MTGLTYKAAGVDIDAGQQLVETIRPHARSTRRPGVVDELGGFGALFDLAAAGFRDPLLVASTDGVGTKLKLAIEVGRHQGIGVDLVAMCVNDLVVQGAQPLFFLDYYASGRLDVAHGAEVIAGIADGCRQAGCALIGGETAELPGLYAGGDYDLAGFAVGAVERGDVLTGARVAEGDVVLGVASHGLHANGFSLVRRIVEAAGAQLADPAPFDRRQSLGEALLTPTRIYVRPCLAAHRAGGLNALAHITGGGLLDNIPRVLPEGLACALDARRWPLPAVFSWLRRHGELDDAELARTFNCGLGMIAVTTAQRAAAIAALLAAEGDPVYEVGEIVAAKDGLPRVQIAGTDATWEVA